MPTTFTDEDVYGPEVAAKLSQQSAAPAAGSAGGASDEDVYGKDVAAALASGESPGPVSGARAAAATAPKGDGYLWNAAAGVLSDMESMAGAPADIARWAFNNAPVTRQVRELRPDAPQIPALPLGSESIQRGLAAIGVDPNKVVASTPGERIARAAGSGAASMLVPALGVEALGARLPAAAAALRPLFGGTSTLGEAAVNLATGTASGLGSGVAEEVAPDKWKPAASFAGALVGGLPAAATGEAIRYGLPAAKQAAIDAVAPMNEAGRLREAARKFWGAAADPETAATALQTEPRTLVPGSPASTGEITGDTGLLGLQRAAETNFNKRDVPLEPDIPGVPNTANPSLVYRAQQAQARADALGAVRPESDPMDVVAEFRRQRQDIDARMQAAETAATQQRDSVASDAAARVDQTNDAVAQANADATERRQALEAAGQGKVSDAQAQAELDAQAARDQIDAARAKAADARGTLPDARPVEEIGAAIRAPAQTARNSIKGQERNAWDVLGEYGDTVVPHPDIPAAAKNILDAIGPTTQPLRTEEAHIFDAASGMGAQGPLNGIIDLRKWVNAASRDELRANGRTPSYARLTRLQDSIESSLDDFAHARAASDAQAVQAGAMAPEDTLYGKLQQVRTAKVADERAASSGENLAGNAGVGTEAVSGAGGAMGADARGSGNASGASGLAPDAGAVESAKAPPAGQGVPDDMDRAREAVARLRDASAITRQRVETFDKGVVGKILKPGSMAGTYAAADSAVPGLVFHPGPGSFEKIQALRAAAGDAVMPAVEDHAAVSLRRAAMRPDGTLDPNRIFAWQQAHGDALRGIPEFADKLGSIAEAERAVPAAEAASKDAAKHGAQSVSEAQKRATADVSEATKAEKATQRTGAAQVKQAQAEANARVKSADQTIAEAADARRAALADYDKQPAAKFLGADSPNDLVQKIAETLGHSDATARFQSIYDATAGNPEVQDSFRAALADALTRNYVSNAEVAGSGVNAIKSDAFQNLLRRKGDALGIWFSPEHMASLQGIADDLYRTNRPVTAVSNPGRSATATDVIPGALGKAKDTIFSLLARGHGVGTGIGVGSGAAAGTVLGGAPGALAGAAGGLMAHVWASMRDAGMHKIDSLVQRAIYDPDFALALRQQVPDSLPYSATARAAWGRFADRLGPLSMFAADRDAETPQRKPHAAGGAVKPHPDPTEAQKAVGNYRKGHVRMHGLDITIENARGGERSGIGGDGKPWSVKMPAAYGYVRGTIGADGDHVDAYVGPHFRAPNVFVVDQVDAGTGRFDEHKAMIGFGTKKQALEIYKRGFSDGKGAARIGAVTTMPVAEFKAWLRSGDTRRALAAE